MSLANQRSDFKAMFTPKTHLKLISRNHLTYKIKIPFQRHVVVVVVVFSLVLYKSYREGTVWSHVSATFVPLESSSQIQLLRNLTIWQKSLLVSVLHVSTERESVVVFLALHSFLAAESQIRGRGKTKRTQMDESHKSHIDLAVWWCSVGCVIGGPTVSRNVVSRESQKLEVGRREWMKLQGRAHKARYHSQCLAVICRKHSEKETKWYGESLSFSFLEEGSNGGSREGDGIWL